MKGSTFDNNSQTYPGSRAGAIASGNGTARIVNSTFRNHKSPYGSAVSATGGAVQIEYCTITENGDPTDFIVWQENSGTISLRNSILWDTNLSPDGRETNGSSQNCVIRTYPWFNLTPPGLAGFSYGNGGPILPLWNGGSSTSNYALVHDSRCINAAVTIADVTTDQRGVARPLYGAPDIGACEFDGATESLVVTTTVDEMNLTSDPAFGAGTSLREALRYANQLGGAQTITFSSSLAGQTINLSTAAGSSDGWDSSSALSVTGNITINGLTTSPGLTLGIDAGAALRYFVVRSGASLTLNNLTITGGKPQLPTFNRGGAISAYGDFTARNCIFTANSSPDEGGAIQNWPGAANLVLENCTFSGNSGGGQGGAISANGTQATFRYLTITNNSSPNSAVLLWWTQGTMVNTIVAGNSNDAIVTGSGGTFTAQSTNNLLGASSATGLTNGSNANQLNVPIASLYLGSLADNGGPIKSISISPGSLAIDAGVTIASLTTDQRGIARPNGSASDIGAFELVQTQAAIPIFSPSGGTYENSVQIALNSASPGTTIRYTLDGSTPTSSNGQIYTGPFVLAQNSTVLAVAYGRGWLDSQITSATYSMLPPLPYWRLQQGLPADGSQDLVNPSGDGVANLLKYAFNLASNAGDLFKSNTTILPENGTAGLPYIEVDSQGRLTIEFVRRKASTNPGIAYIVETSSNLTNWTALNLATAFVVSIDSKWERVTIIDPAVTAQRFGRVRIQSLGVYYNDFNSGLGPATLRGDATWTGGSVKLTDENTGGAGAVIFDGVTVGPQLTGFSAPFLLALGPTTTSVPADGAAFAVGNLGSGTWGESGPGGHSLAIGFDTFKNGTGAQNEIGIHLWVNGVHIAADATNPYTNGTLVPVEITYDQASGITVKFNGTTIFNNVPISGFSFLTTDKFGLSGRTGAFVERAVIDDVEIAPR